MCQASLYWIVEWAFLKWKIRRKKQQKRMMKCQPTLHNWILCSCLASCSPREDKAWCWEDLIRHLHKKSLNLISSYPSPSYPNSCCHKIGQSLVLGRLEGPHTRQTRRGPRTRLSKTFNLPICIASQLCTGWKFEGHILKLQKRKEKKNTCNKFYGDLEGWEPNNFYFVVLDYFDIWRLDFCLL